jgi:hypothetical protein
MTKDSPAMAGERIFLSSTFADLKAYRSQLYEALVAGGYVVERMESFGSSGATPIQTCRIAVERSVAMITLVGYRYGSYAPGLGESYTEAEYEHAQALGLPIFAYSRQGLASGVARSTESAEKKAHVLEFRNTLRSELVMEPKSFRTRAQLVEHVLIDLSNWLQDGLARRPSFRRRKADIDDLVSYADKTVLRKHATHRRTTFKQALDAQARTRARGLSGLPVHRSTNVRIERHRHSRRTFTTACRRPGCRHCLLREDERELRSF